MINWCPIGRNANDDQRKFFVHYDTAYERTYREQLKEQLERTLRHRGVLKHVTIKFGGSTSFDIYPNGWDKRYCLTRGPILINIYFLVLLKLYLVFLLNPPCFSH